MKTSPPERNLPSTAIQAAGEDLFRQIIDRLREATENVHPVRVAIKRLRAWWRLLTDRDDPASLRFDCRLRDVNRSLSPWRNARVLAETWQLEVGEASGKLARAWAGIGPEMSEWIARSAEPPPIATTNLVTELEGLHEDWHRRGEEDVDLVSQLIDTYRRCRRGVRRLTTDSSAEAVHEFRKRAKRWQYQLECLPAADTKRWQRDIAALKRMTDLLGQHHDRAVLADGVIDQVADSSERRSILKRLRSQQLAVLRKGLRLSDRVFDDSPRKLQQRLELASGGT